MSRTVLVDSVDLTNQIRLESFSFTEAANRGEVGTGGFDLLDESTSVSVPALKLVQADESAASPTRFFTGFTHQRNTQRGIQRVAGAREWMVELTDINILADDYVLAESDDANRPEETDYERVTWLLGTRFNLIGNVDAGVVPNTNTVTMDAQDYTGQKPSDVLAQCSEAAGKMWFIYNYGSGRKLYYDLATGTSLTSSAKISDVAADVDSSTVWAPYNAPMVKRSPDRIYSTVHFKYKNGTVTVTDDTTETSFRVREAAVEDQSVKTQAHAIAKATAFLEGAANEILEITNLAIVVPAANVNDILAGQRVQVKLTRHGISSYTYYRVIRRTVQPLGGTGGFSDVDYLVNIGLMSDILAAANGGRDGGDGTGDGSPCGNVALIPMYQNLSLESGGGEQIFAFGRNASELQKWTLDLQTQIWDVTASGGSGYITHQPGTYVPVCFGDRAYRRDDGSVRWSITDEIVALAAETQDVRRYWVTGDTGSGAPIGFPFSGMGTFNANFGPTGASLNYTVWRGFVTSGGSVKAALSSGGQIYFYGATSAWNWERLRWVTDASWNNSSTPPSVATIDSFMAGAVGPGGIGALTQTGTVGTAKAAGWYTAGGAVAATNPTNASGSGVGSVSAGQWVILMLANDVGTGHDQTSVAHGLQLTFTISGTATLDGPLSGPGGPVLQVRETLDGALVTSIDLGDEGSSMRRSANGQFAMVQQSTDTILRYDKDANLDDTVTITDFFPNDDWAVNDAHELFQLDGDVLTKYDAAGILIKSVDLNAREGYTFPTNVDTGTGNQVIADDFVRVVGSVSDKAVLLTLSTANLATKNIDYFESDDTAQAQAVHHHVNGSVYVAGSATGTEFKDETLPSSPYGWIVCVCPTGIDPSGPSTLADLTDVNTSGLMDGETLVWDTTTSSWIPGTASGGSIEVKEIDGTPDVTGVTTIKVSNTRLTDNTGGVVTVTIPTSADYVSGGSDAIKLDDFATPDDNTDLNSTTGHHGLLQKLPGGTSTFLRADGSFAVPSGSGVTDWTVITKASDESVASSTTLQDDDELLFTATSGKAFEFESVILYICPTGAGVPDIKTQYAEDSTTTRGSYTVVGLSTADAQITPTYFATATGSNPTFGTDSTLRMLWFRGTHVGAGGSLKFRWAQNNSNVGSVTVKAGSVLRYRQLN